ncbi:Putative AphA-like transcriptional regulator [Caenispirillum bisanense]|uniref:AphA-like transcriptional regulator n=2 Tax=Caenispirillum bisanense TaxID=414052 RepID=A0A286G3P4_9PROT|nr:Putative AphA-like transcriptional regulator [Caenispirillum bisanense]
MMIMAMASATVGHGGLEGARCGAATAPRVVATRASCRAKEAACLAVLGLTQGTTETVAAAEIEAVLATVGAEEWHPPQGLVTQAIGGLLAAELVACDGRGVFRATPAGRDALHCLLMAPVAAPAEPVDRVILSLRLCLLDRLPERERAVQADALVSAWNAVLDARRRSEERLAHGLPLLGLWSRQRRRRLEDERDLCARIRDALLLGECGGVSAASA